MSLNIAEVFTLVSSFAGIALGNQCFCPTTFDPVCASNGNLFDNACALECYNLENQEELQVIGTSHCMEHMKISPSSVDQRLDTCLTHCKVDYHPIVNTPHRKIYWNECYYNCETKKQKHKSQHYMFLLGALSAIECTIVVLTRYIRKRKHYSVYE